MQINFHFSRLLVWLLLAYSALSAQHFEQCDFSGMHGFKGNIHTHAREGESDSSVEAIVQWYRDHGYHFLVITDHSTITRPASPLAPADSFLLIPGEEVVGYGNQDKVEINAFNIVEAIQPIHSTDVPSALQHLIDAVRGQRGIPMINHPNYQWRLSADVLLHSQRCNLFELYNGFPGVHNEGDEFHLGLEQIWDVLLSSGKRIYGVAADDAHSYQQFSPDLSNPGRGWVMVRAKHLDVEEIMHNLDAGLFYSSTGVEVQNLIIESTRIEISMKDRENTQTITDFIGSNGNLLLRTDQNPAVYELSAETRYVRAKVMDSEGHCAWMQPVFIAP